MYFTNQPKIFFQDYVNAQKTKELLAELQKNNN
jgi:hypothetical protein